MKSPGNIVIADIHWAAQRCEWHSSCRWMSNHLVECEWHPFWANYNDLSRGHLKLWFSKGIPQKSPEFKSRKYTNLPRSMFKMEDVNPESVGHSDHQTSLEILLADTTTLCPGCECWAMETYQQMSVGHVTLGRDLLETECRCGGCWSSHKQEQIVSVIGFTV